MAKEQVRAAFRGSDGPEASRAEPDVHSYLLVRRVAPLVKHLFGGIILLKEWGRVGSFRRMVGAHATEAQAIIALHCQAGRKRRGGFR
jgi:hypothetical protein